MKRCDVNRQRRTKIAHRLLNKVTFSPASKFVPKGYSSNETWQEKYV